MIDSGDRSVFLSILMSMMLVMVFPVGNLAMASVRLFFLAKGSSIMNFGIDVVVVIDVEDGGVVE